MTNASLDLFLRNLCFSNSSAVGLALREKFSSPHLHFDADSPWILLEAAFVKILESFWEGGTCALFVVAVTAKARWLFFQGQHQNTHGGVMCIGGGPLGQLQGSYTKGPDVGP